MRGWLGVTGLGRGNSGVVLVTCYATDALFVFPLLCIQF